MSSSVAAPAPSRIFPARFERAPYFAMASPSRRQLLDPARGRDGACAPGLWATKRGVRQHQAAAAGRTRVQDAPSQHRCCGQCIRKLSRQARTDCDGEVSRPPHTPHGRASSFSKDTTPRPKLKAGGCGFRDGGPPPPRLPFSFPLSKPCWFTPYPHSPMEMFPESTSRPSAAIVCACEVRLRHSMLAPASTFPRTEGVEDRVAPTSHTARPVPGTSLITLTFDMV